MELSLLVELRRRRVFRALIAYGIAAFAVLQIVEPVMHGFRWPEAVLSYVVAALAAGFPLVVALAWIFDVNQGRIERTPGAPLRAPLALALAAIGVLAAAPGLAWYFVVRKPAPAAGPPSIAVLPFADMSPGKDQEYFSDGIAEEILDALAQVDGLRVTGRTSSFSFKGKGEDLATIAEKLHVANVLEGSVRKDGNRVRVTAQLIAAADGYHVWSKTFDRELTGIFAVQDEIARAVVEALKLKLAPLAKRATNPDAYAQFLLGNELLRQHPDRRPVVAAYERSVKLDPGYAPAWARLSIEASWLMTQDASPELFSTAKQEMLLGAERAMALDPTLPDSYLARGTVRSVQWDWSGARSDYERAVASAPSSAEGHLGYGLFLRDALEFSAARRELQVAAGLDPLDRRIPNNIGIVLTFEGRFDEAREAFAHARTLIRDPTYDSWEIGCTHLLEGNLPAADEWFQKSIWESDRLYGRVAVAHARGQAQESNRAFAGFEAKFGETLPFEAAALLAFRGDRDRAFDTLQKAQAVGDPALSEIRANPMFRSLRGDARWKALLRRMNLPAE